MAQDKSYKKISYDSLRRPAKYIFSPKSGVSGSKKLYSSMTLGARAVVSFIIKHGDEAAELATKHGDEITSFFVKHSDKADDIAKVGRKSLSNNTKRHLKNILLKNSLSKLDMYLMKNLRKKL